MIPFQRRHNMKRNNSIEKENLRKRVDFISKKILKEFLPYSGFSERQQDKFINTLSEFKKFILKHCRRVYLLPNCCIKVLDGHYKNNEISNLPYINDICNIFITDNYIIMQDDLEYLNEVYFQSNPPLNNWLKKNIFTFCR